MRRYPVPWGAVLGLWRHIAAFSAASQDAFIQAFIDRLDPPARVTGLEHLPCSPRLVVAANHYQRKGLWIAYPASVITRALGDRYRLADPPLRWVVTANWPPLRAGRWKVPSPGNWLLPRVANALSCYGIPFAGNDPTATARSLLRLLREARTLEAPIGLFPEGVAGTAGRLAEPLPGVDRLLIQLARQDRPVVPAGIREDPDGLAVRFGPLIPPASLLQSTNAARLVMTAVAGLIA